MDQQKIGSFLKELRKEKGITQEKLAEELRVSNRTISRWETGSSLPDISLLVEIADFYDVDVREIIEGEKKSEMMKEEIKEVADKMAVYAAGEKSNLLRMIQAAGFAGILIMVVSVIVQCLTYKPGVGAFVAMATTMTALLLLGVITLYVTGKLEKLVRKKGFITVVKVTSILLISVCFVMAAQVGLIMAVGVWDYASPFRTISGAENYNKSKLMKELGNDFDIGFMTFPENTVNMKKAEYLASSKTGLFDSDGCVFLRAEYDAEQFAAEIERLQKITCRLKYREENVEKEIWYDESMYYYPAYIASDGFDGAYEYALIDEAKLVIIYAALSYPEYSRLDNYQEYLKKEKEVYHLKPGNALENFTIYAFQPKGLDGWIEYSDLQ